MKYVFIGDIHTKYDIFKSAVDYGLDNGYTIIAVGDYVDSFDLDKTGIERTKALRGQMKSLDLADWLNNNGHYALIGNHELSYIWDDFRCSGYQKDQAMNLKHKIKTIDLEPFKFIYPEVGDPILVSHAGLNKKFIEQVWGLDWLSNHDAIEELEMKMYEEVQSYNSAIYEWTHFDKSNPDPLSVGQKIYGGIFWNRPSDMETIDGLRQVFGHTKTIAGHYSGNTKVAGIYNFEGRKKNIPTARHFNIDNLEYGLGELLTYNEDTDRFDIIEKGEYYETDKDWT